MFTCSWMGTDGMCVGRYYLYEMFIYYLIIIWHKLHFQMTGSAAAGGGVGYNVSDDDRGTGRRRRQSKRQKEGSQKRKVSHVTF